MKNVINIRHYLLTGLSLFTLFFATACDDEEDVVDESLFPVASFTSSATTVEAGGTITFSDNSTNNPSLWTWNFEGGDPTYSAAPNPTVTYPGAGTYTVTMKARNDFGADEVVMEQLIEVTAPPVVDIDVVPQVRLDFENSLENVGLVDIDAATGGTPNYGVRPGGGGAYEMSASNTLTIPGYTGVNGPATRSVATWVKVDGGDRITVSHWGAQATGSRATWAITPAGWIRFEVAGGGINGVTLIRDGEWHHIAHTWDGSVLRMYVDGVEDITWETGIIDTGSGGETDVEIGTQLGARPFVGAMDDFRIFTEVLTPEEVKTLSEIR